MRLFVALDIPDEAVSYVGRIQRRIKQEIRADRWQPLSNLHLTLHFLGEVEEALVPKICEDMNLVSSIVEPFSLVMGQFGVFPHPDRPRVVWIGLEGQKKSLEQVHALLGKRFDLHQGLHYDKRNYHPHITIARGPHRSCVFPLPLEEWNQRFLEENSPHWKVGGIHLYQSELRPGGAVHTIIHTSSFLPTPKP